MNKKRSFGVTLFGWLLIAYFLYIFIYPIVAIIIASIVESPIGNMGPIGAFSLLQALGVSPLLLYFFGITSFFIAIIVPICSLIGGILLLKLKESGRKFVIVIFSIDFVVRLTLLLMGLINMHIRKILIAELSAMIFFYAFILFDILIIYFFTRPKIKEQFLLQ